MNDDVVGRTPLTLARPCGRNAGRLPGPDHPLRLKRNFDFCSVRGQSFLPVLPNQPVRCVFSSPTCARCTTTCSPELQPSSQILLIAAHHPSIAQTSRTESGSPPPPLSTTHNQRTTNAGDERLAPISHLRPRTDLLRAHPGCSSGADDPGHYDHPHLPKLGTRRAISWASQNPHTTVAGPLGPIASLRI